jgi:hypothetical protein
MIDPTAILPPPSRNDHPDIELWLDEQLWGHRLWDNETAWLVFLEFLNVAEACHREQKLLTVDSASYPNTFRPHKRMFLRNIVFNNEVIFRVAERHSDDASAWREWLAWIEDRAQGIHVRDFSYLRSRFRSFHEFAALVGLIRQSAVENDTNRRWSSRFVFPFGPNALYEDLNITPSGSVSREYINFGRSGELLYLMLARSKYSTDLKPHIEKMFGKNRWNSLLGLFQPEQADDFSTRGKSYLPYSNHPSFDILGEDWLRIMQLRLPGFDVYPYLVILGTYHLFLYHLRIANAYCASDKDNVLICEILAPKKTFVRELSSTSYLGNGALSLLAVKQYIDRIEQSEDWRSALSGSDAFTKCRQLLVNRVRWGDDYEGPPTPEALISELRSNSFKRHRQHLGNVHRNYGRQVGLVSKRGTNKLRYAPNDLLLKTLVLSNVPKRMELGQFLQVLFERYGLVLGEKEAEVTLPSESFDKKAFQANARRLEYRLASLGLLQRLSDACAYVENPYAFGSV